MKAIVVVLILLNFVFANEHLESIYENIILKTAKQTIKNVQKVQENIKESKYQKAKLDFKELVKSWKSMQSFYLLGDLNNEYIDTPRYLDIFHHGNEDIKIQLNKIIKDKEDLSLSLYKNSHKTINALEYILFTKDLNIQRIKAISLHITATMIKNLTSIYEGYKNAKNDFISDESKANAIMLNSLIENSYKLKEWRIGDPSGLSRKYKGNPDNRRAEYIISNNSILAISSILDTHLMILDNQAFKNLGSLIQSYNIKGELNDAVQYLKNAKHLTQSIKNDDFTNAGLLYKEVKKLHSSYYITLIGKLKITAKILDADGD
jgi:hypothetical protein